MSDKNFPDVIKEIHLKDQRYGKGAYFFIREALDHTLKSLEQKKPKNKVKGGGGGAGADQGMVDRLIDEL